MQSYSAFNCCLPVLVSVCLSVAAGSLDAQAGQMLESISLWPAFEWKLQMQVMVIDHDPEEAATHGVVDTPHGGVGVPAEAHKDAQGRSMHPHNQPQPPTPPCYAPVHGDADHDHSF